MMRRLCELTRVSILVIFLLNTQSTWAKRGSSSSSSKKTSSSSNKGGTQTKPSSTQPANYPRQPQSPNRNPNPYPGGGSYPGVGNPNPGGVPRQNPGSYPGAGNPNPGGVPRQNPGAGSYPNQYPGRANPGGYPNQNPAGGYPAGGNPAGYPNQNPGRGNYPNQYPAGGGYPNQYPGRAGTNQGGYPNQYPAAGGYPVRGGNTGQGWGQGGVNPGGYPGQGGGYGGGYGGGGYGGGGYGGGYGGGGGYPNWNPNNKILSPRYGGGGYGQGGYGMGGGGGSPFSRSVQNMGYQPQSSGFAKKAMLAAGVGAVAGMAVGYGLGRFPRPHFNFRNPEEEQYYNSYMYRRYGTESTDKKDYGRDYVYKPPPRAESYDSFMDKCMNRTVPLKDQSSTTPKSPAGGDKEDDDTVSIEEIGYPALIEQVKARRCVEQYMVYSESFLQERKAEQQSVPPAGGNSPPSYGVMQLFTSLFVLLSSMLLLQ
ncbi:prion protein b [Tautogolabrus adspersus]